MIPRLPSRIGILAPACLAILMLGAAPLFAQWYLSDESGVIRDQIDESDVDQHEYVVNVEHASGEDVQTLYHNGEAISHSELDYTDGVLVTKRSYEGDTLVATEHYLYWADGSIRSMRRVEGASSVEYRYRDGHLAQEWSYSGAQEEAVVYDAAGRPAERIRWDGGDEVEHENRDYWGPAATDGVKTVTLVADGVQTVSRYDESGKLMQDTVAKGADVTSDRQRIYDGDLLVEEREVSGGVQRRWQYEYSDGSLVRERYTEDGILVTLTEYGGDPYDRVETIYHNGEAALRISYIGEERAQEEVMRNGEVIRTRTFTTGGEQ